MDEKKFVAFLFRYMLKEHFKTKAGMARKLDVQRQTLLLNFKNLDRAKGGTDAFEKLVVYCCRNGIDILQIYQCYIQEAGVCKKGDCLKKSDDCPCAFYAIYHIIRKLFVSICRYVRINPIFDTISENANITEDVIS